MNGITKGKNLDKKDPIINSSPNTPEYLAPSGWKPNKLNLKIYCMKRSTATKDKHINQNLIILSSFK